MNPLWVRLGLQSKEFSNAWKKVAESLEKSKKHTKELSKTFTQLSNTVNSSADKANEGIKRIDQNTKKLTRSMSKLEKIARGAFIAWGVYQISDAIRNIIRYTGEAVVEMDRLERSMKAVTGSTVASEDAITFLRTETQRLGLSFRDNVKAFGQLMAAAKGTNISYQQVKEVFLGVAEASTAMQLNAEQNKLALYALQQMISKGVVTMEELRRQLGDQIPGAFQIASRAMNTTTADLIQMVSTGELLAEDFVPRFARPGWRLTAKSCGLVG
jgi:tape measure domain-containing protein